MKPRCDACGNTAHIKIEEDPDIWLCGICFEDVRGAAIREMDRRENIAKQKANPH